MPLNKGAQSSSSDGEFDEDLKASSASSEDTPLIHEDIVEEENYQVVLESGGKLFFTMRGQESGVHEILVTNSRNQWCI